MSDETANTVQDLPIDAGDGPVVRYRFGVPHAAMVVCAVALSFAVLIPAPGLLPAPPEEHAMPTLFAPTALDTNWTQADIDFLRNAFRTPPPAAEPKDAPPDPRIDAAFRDLDHLNLRQLDRFAASYGRHPYALEKGYAAQVDTWRERLRWQHEEARLKKEQSEAQWDYD